jgi:hypothetical protein
VANTYVRALDTAEELSAERAFRGQIERYTRAQLLNQIQEAQLGPNKNALMAFISARRHLYDLSQDKWPAMAKRFGTDAKFIKQSRSMIHFLSKTDCDPFANDFLTKDGTSPSLVDRIGNQISKLVEPPARQKTQSPLTLDPDNFDGYHAPRYSVEKAPMTLLLSPSQNAPIFLGLFTFVISVIIWTWLRLGNKRRRTIRYPCSFPVVIFDGVTPALGSLLDISQFGAKLETNMDVRKNSKILLTMNQLKRKARVTWTNAHFTGIKFDTSLSEAEMTGLLSDFSDRVAKSKDRPGGFELLLQATYAPSESMRSEYLATLSNVSPLDTTLDGTTSVDGEFNGITVKNAFKTKQA